MGFEERHKARMDAIEVVLLATRALAFAYLSLHAAVTWLAYQAAGALEAVATLLTLGFGDLYWAFRFWRTGEEAGPLLVAAAAALLCFASWGLRPLFNRWSQRFTAAMMADAAGEIGRQLDEIQKARGDEDRAPEDREPAVRADEDREEGKRRG